MKYYSIHRPIGPGTFPHKDKVQELHNFDTMEMVPEIGRTAWGWIVYSEPLPDKDAADYELIPGQ